MRLGLRLYDVQVRQMATYGSCVCATRFHMVAPHCRVVSNALKKRHMHFLRGWCSWCHLRGSEPKWLVYRELGRLPFHYYWWRDMLRFANRVAGLPGHSIWRKMMRDSLSSAVYGLGHLIGTDFWLILGMRFSRAHHLLLM